MTGDMPMPPERFGELVQQRREAGAPDPLPPVHPREPAALTSPLAAELLAEAADRPLESGELLLVSEEATLADLEAAAAAVPSPPTAPVEDPEAGDPMAALLAEPRLLSQRVWDAMAWRPDLPEYLQMLDAALRGGQAPRLSMLVGHVEDWPERVEHCLRLRALLTAAGPAVPPAVAVVEDDPAAWNARGERFAAVAEAARPRGADTDRRHARALARLAVGSHCRVE